MGKGPLSGLKVVEFAGIGPGPFCGMLLSDLGADVVRIDRKGQGRSSPADITSRGRRSIGLDLKNPAAIETCLKLMEGADAVFEGFRPGVMERLGLGPDVALKRNPKLVFGRMTGWGQFGPYDNAIVQTLTKTPNALGVFGYSFLENNMDTVKAATVDGVAPTFETISNGTYPVSRSLYIYVKKANVGVIPGLREYVNAFVSDAATGKGGYLQQRGLIPLAAEEHAAQKTSATELKTISAPEK